MTTDSAAERRKIMPGRPVRGSSSGRPIMAALDLLGRRGALRLLWELRDGSATSFRALRQATELPPATLNVRLREMRGAALVELNGGYRLTGTGAALAGALAPLSAWATAWAETVAGDGRTDGEPGPGPTVSRPAPS
ncbi:transcriptional regulator [Chelatococcus reniformis]|uniref:Transcriptional regulator n=1 Tax=Chelatococcus reniformis TaxID=1494448 RepID=A0A916UHQ1_9HYPH|nr:transcriptional regulator [Chelatococcus reniformis]GGC73304.1 hypothetical protein GCM10010994_34610 [Chelatococcus reniformis]